MEQNMEKITKETNVENTSAIHEHNIEAFYCD